MFDNYQKIYSDIYSKINLELVLKHYNIDFRTYHSKKGKEYLCQCPFHDDSTPSFSIQQKTGLFNCFVCGGGDFVSFIKNLEKLKSTKEAIEFLKVKVGINESIDVFSIVKNSKEHFACKNNNIEDDLEEKFELKEITLPKSEPAENYYNIVKKRVCLDDIKKYGMRYCIDDRIYHDRLIMPIIMNGKLITFAARDMSGKAETWSKVKQILKEKKLSKHDRQVFIDKYLYKKILYPSGTPMGKIFFNWDEAIKRKEVVICEGIFDALRILKYGYNALALLSCHLNSYKAKLLVENFEKIYIALDNDDKEDSFGKKYNPGQEAAQKIMKDYLTDIQVFNIVLPVGKDPDDCTKDEFDRAFNESVTLKKMFTLALQ